MVETSILPSIGGDWSKVMEEKNFITRNEHDEFARRMTSENNAIREENTRQNHRIDNIEKTLEKTTSLTISVEKMAVSMEQMAKELKQQGERLEAIESKPAKRWDLVISGVIGALAAALGSGVVAAIIGGMR